MWCGPGIVPAVDDDDEGATAGGRLPALLTTDQAAQLLGLTPAQVRALVFKGRLPVLRLTRKIWRYRLEAVQRLADERAGPPKHGPPD